MQRDQGGGLESTHRSGDRGLGLNLTTSFTAQLVAVEFSTLDLVREVFSDDPLIVRLSEMVNSRKLGTDSRHIDDGTLVIGCWTGRFEDTIITRT